MEDAFSKLDKQKVAEFTLHLGDDNKLLDRKPKNALEIVNTDRLRLNVSQAQHLARTLDKEVGIEKEGLPNFLERARQVIAERAETQGDISDNAEDADVGDMKKELDMVLVYLRNVHTFCYYCGLQFDSMEELSDDAWSPTAVR